MAEHNEKGRKGEELAVTHLQSKGYSILEKNWRYNRCEVDIIARIGGTLVFVEVKTRDTEYFGYPESFVTRKKQDKLAEAVEGYLELHPVSELDVRYDVIAVIMDNTATEILHIEDAFFPDNLGLL